MTEAQIDLADLDLSQLAGVKQQLEQASIASALDPASHHRFQELEHLTTSFGHLRSAQTRFGDCRNSVQQLVEDADILVPLTSSISFFHLYVPGKLANAKSVIVDVGTGYYVEKSVEDAKKFYDSKVDYVKENLAQLTETITTKQNNLRVLVTVMQDKAMKK